MLSLTGLYQPPLLKIQKIIDVGARPVIGTTGFTLEQIKLLSQECESKK